tara:strand:- start:293 stop:559 length:267 start_codon:yes stop_codon:yes gene_type:complete
MSKDNKRTDFPGKKYAAQVQMLWDEKYSSEISYVLGDEWWAGNLSYHLKSRPKWVPILDEKEAKKLKRFKENINLAEYGYPAKITGNK